MPAPPAVPPGTRLVRVRPRWMPPPIGLVVVGLLLVAVALVVRWQAERVPDGWILTVATVQEILPEDPDCMRNCGPTAVVDAPGTRTHLVDRTMAAVSQLQPGDTLRLAYDPRGSRWKVMGVSSITIWGLAVLGGLCIGAAAAVARFTAPKVRYPLQAARRPSV